MTEGVSAVGSEVIVQGATGGVKSKPHIGGWTVIIGRVESELIWESQSMGSRRVTRGVVEGENEGPTSDG